jgi:glycosyltransferase involved in cell wall biosynthesis
MQLLDVGSLTGSCSAGEDITLMAACDWIVMFSIWWENSAVVMLKARLAGRPMIMSGIGGMAEKMDPVVDRQFTVADPAELARVMTEIVTANDRSDAKRLRALAEERLSRDAAELARHVGLYEALLAG